jgi:hypothetical protein
MDADPADRETARALLDGEGEGNAGLARDILAAEDVVVPLPRAAKAAWQRREPDRDPAASARLAGGLRSELKRCTAIARRAALDG